MRFATLLPAAALVAVAAAAPNAVEARDNQCSTGENYCCNQKFSNQTGFSGTLGNGVLTGLLDLVLSVVANVGLTCSPITGIGLGSGGVCSIQQACCDNVQADGLINIVCNPIAINL